MGNIADFIKAGHNKHHVKEAVRQQRDLSYFCESKIQEDVNVQYLTQWNNKNFIGSDAFINWVKTVFKSDNFLAFFKYLRFPLSSAKLVNDEIIPQLRRVFQASDSNFNYTVGGKDIPNPEELQADAFSEALFNAILFKHNSIVVHDLDGDNKPFREILDIADVVSIETECGQIERLAYRASIETTEGETMHGYTYMDGEVYAFVDSDYNVIMEVPHDLGEAPADWLSSSAFSTDNDVVRKSIFSYTKNDLEEYVFLRTLQKMTEPNGAIPITVKYKGSSSNSKAGKDSKGSNLSDPMASTLMQGNTATLHNQVQGSENELQAGTVISVPISKKIDGTIETDLAKNYINFHYIPKDALDYLNERIKELQTGIIISVLGDYSEQNARVMNELQVSKSYANKEDKLRWLSSELGKIRQVSDYTMLALAYGPDRVKVSVFYGSKFFLETEQDLYAKFTAAPNAIERRNTLIEISQNRNKHSKDRAEREKILYSILPYVSDVDFNIGIARGTMTDLVFEYQTRFDHWVRMFEANYGDIVEFWDATDNSESVKLLEINNLIKQIITIETGIVDTPKVPAPAPAAPTPSTIPTTDPKAPAPTADQTGPTAVPETKLDPNIN